MIQIQLRPEVESQLAAEAQARGLELNRYIEEIVSIHSDSEETESRQRAVEAMLAFRHEHKPRLDGLKIPDLVHEGHPY